MYDMHNGHTWTWAAQGTLTNTGSPNQVTSGAIDLRGAVAVEVLALIGSIDELGSSPVGTAKADLVLYDSDDGVTFAVVDAVDVVVDSSVTVAAGVVATSTSKFDTLKAGYRGDKRYIQAALVGTGLTNGGPVAIGVLTRDRHSGVPT